MYNQPIGYVYQLKYKMGGFTMKDKINAWKKFEETGNIMDYLDYKSQQDSAEGLLPFSDNCTKNNLRRVNNEFRVNGYGDKRKRFK